LNLLELKIFLEFTPQGVLVSAKVEGDLFKDLPTHTQVTRLVDGMLRKMILPEEIPKSIACEIFTQLPTKAVKVNDSWPVNRKLCILKELQVDVDGMATLQAVQARNGANMAKILEKFRYKLNHTKYVKSMIENIVGKLPLPSVKVEGQFEPKEDIIVKVEHLFNIDYGFNMLTIFKEQKIPFGGVLKLSMDGDSSEMKIETIISGSTNVILMPLF
jgi:hypothetical protein